MYRTWPTWLPLGNMVAFVIGVCLAYAFAQRVGTTMDLVVIGGLAWLAFSTLRLIRKG